MGVMVHVSGVASRVVHYLLLWFLCIAESSLLSDVAYVMCLDSVGSGSELFVHVSKPPKNDSAVDFLLKVCAIDVVDVAVGLGIET